ncbi:MAG: small multi-drug export protein [Candidatus Gracilibacteria bacterium]|jgi:uncharacterized membrane protein
MQMLYPYFWIFFGSMLPVLELRGAIPVGIERFHLPIFIVYILAVFGCMLPILIVLKVLGPISDFLMKRVKFINKILTAIFDHTRKKYGSKMNKIGTALVLFIAIIPVPFIGGAWTAALIAFVFGIRYFRAVFFIFIGTIIQGLIVLAGMYSFSAIWRMFF